MVVQADGTGHLTQVRGNDLRDLHVVHAGRHPARSQRIPGIFGLHGQVQEYLQPRLLRPRGDVARVPQAGQHRHRDGATQGEDGVQLLKTSPGVVEQDGHAGCGGKRDELDIVRDQIEAGAAHPDPDECRGLLQDLRPGRFHVLIELARQIDGAATRLDVHGARCPLVDLPALPHHPG